MGWVSQNRGYIVCAVLGILVGALGMLWIKRGPGRLVITSPVISKPAPVEPKWEREPAKRLGGSIGTIDKDQPPPALPKIPTPQPDQETPKVDTLCPPFTLHLVSDDSVPKQFGLDSVSLAYRWPPGNHYFLFWPRPQIAAHSSTKTGNQSFCSIGFSTAYVRYRNNLYGNVYVRLNLFDLNLKTGYHHQTRQQLSWFVSLGKEWPIF